MKNLTIIAAVLLILSGCASYPYRESAIYVDYSQFVNDGVFLTEANSVSFDYTPLGSVSVLVTSGERKSTRASRYQYTDLNGNREMTETYNKWEYPSQADAIAIAVDSAKARGGNGIINLKTEFILHQPVKGHDRYSYLVTGMVIRK